MNTSTVRLLNFLTSLFCAGASIGYFTHSEVLKGFISLILSFVFMVLALPSVKKWTGSKLSGVSIPYRKDMDALLATMREFLKKAKVGITSSVTRKQALWTGHVFLVVSAILFLYAYNTGNVQAFHFGGITATFATYFYINHFDVWDYVKTFAKKHKIGVSLVISITVLALSVVHNWQMALLLSFVSTVYFLVKFFGVEGHVLTRVKKMAKPWTFGYGYGVGALTWACSAFVCLCILTEAGMRLDEGTLSYTYLGILCAGMYGVWQIKKEYVK